MLFTVLECLRRFTEEIDSMGVTENGNLLITVAQLQRSCGHGLWQKLELLLLNEGLFFLHSLNKKGVNTTVCMFPFLPSPLYVSQFNTRMVNIEK